MTITEKSFILVREPTGTITADDLLEALLRSQLRPILWFRKGLSCVVPIEVLENLLDQIDMYVSGGRKGKCELKIDWKQCWPLTDSRAITVLSGLEY